MCENIIYKWDANFIDVYKTNITKFKNNIEETIYQAEIKSSLLDDINNILNVISDALKKAAYNSGMGKSLKKTKKRRRQLPHKPWYDESCETSKKPLIKCRNNYRREQSLENLNFAKKSSKKYNKIVHKAYSKCKHRLIHKLRLLESENPKEYWKIIKEGKTSEAHVFRYIQRAF